jgi:hypothetical protein
MVVVRFTLTNTRTHAHAHAMRMIISFIFISFFRDGGPGPRAQAKLARLAVGSRRLQPRVRACVRWWCCGSVISHRRERDFTSQ